jgi:putative FmdB family regulatory protein
MPTYDYVCDACDHGFEEFQSITASPLRKCPECGKLKLRRLIGGGSGFIFKGSDYRSEGYKEAAKKDKESSGGKTEAKSDKKSKGKSDKKDSKKSKAKKEAA